MNSFKFQSEPKALKAKGKFRENDATLTLMSDPRVVRGNTHTLARKVALAAQTGKGTTAPGLPRSGKNATKVDQSENVDQLPFPTYFYEPTTFTGSDLSISQYLEEDPAKSFKSFSDESTQYDNFQPRPVTPDYVPKKTGIDCATQIENPSELFEFDKEVKPILDVFVKKTLEQALFEVQTEAELLALDNAASEFREKKALEEAWNREREQAVIEEVKKKNEKLSQRMKEQREQSNILKLIAGRNCVKQLLPSLVENIYDDLYKSGTFVEETEEVIRKDVLPEVMDIACKRAAQALVADELMCDILKAAQEKYDATHFKGNKINIVRMSFSIPVGKLGGDATSDVIVGPITLSDNDTVETLAVRIQVSFKVKWYIYLFN